MTDAQKCLIWDTPAKVSRDNSILTIYVDSPRSGGKYSVELLTGKRLISLAHREKVRLTNWLVEQRRLGTTCPEITTNAVEEAKQWRDIGLSDRADNLLMCFATRSDRLGAVLYFGTDDPGNPEYLELLAHAGCVDAHYRSALDYLVRYFEWREFVQWGKADQRRRPDRRRLFKIGGTGPCSDCIGPSRCSDVVR